jgi:hypothetical protein
MRTIHVLFAAVAVASLSVACGGSTNDSSKGNDGDADSVASALDADDGAMKPVDEAPHFADPSVAEIEEMVAAPMTMQDAPGAELPTMRSYHVALLWGHLPAPNDGSDADTDPKPIDWTGTVSVAKGAIGVSRTLAFDARDRLERREDKSEVSFSSHTMPFVDGLFLHVVVPADGPQTLRFDTVSLKADIDLSKLGEKFVGGKRLDDGRNGLVFAGYPDVKGCARGLAFGRWVKVRANLGKFRGRVVAGDGDTIGHVRGIWGHAPKRDANVFFGKYISVDGTHRGLFGGRYGGGEAIGVWGTKDPRNVGALQIEYGDGYDKDDGRGVWLGRWSEKCAP